MAQTFQGRRVAEGLSIDYTPGSDVSAGDVVVQENVIGIAPKAIAASVKGALDVHGVFAIVKKQEAFATVGAPVFWDATGDPYGGTAGTGAATATVGANRRIGFVIVAAGANDEYVICLLRSSLALTAEAFALADLTDVDTVLYTAGLLLIADGTSKYADVAMSGDGTIAANGALTLTDALTKVVADPGDAGAIAVTASGSCPLVSAGAETRTLAIPPVVGRVLSLSFKTDVDDIVLTVASAVNQTGNNTLTFADAGDHIMLIGTDVGGTLYWRVVCNDGVALSTV